MGGQKKGGAGACFDARGGFNNDLPSEEKEPYPGAQSMNEQEKNRARGCTIVWKKSYESRTFYFHISVKKETDAWSGAWGDGGRLVVEEPFAPSKNNAKKSGAESRLATTKGKRTKTRRLTKSDRWSFWLWLKDRKAPQTLPLHPWHSTEEGRRGLRRSEK